jgi:hypothetical protein
MTPQTGRAAVARSARRGATAAVIVPTGLELTGCGVVKAVKQVSHDVASHKAAINAFTGQPPPGAQVLAAHHGTK